jgi:hypothetical protein
MQDLFIKEDTGRVKKVGTIYKDCFYKRVKESKHLMIVNNSWGIDNEIMNLLFLECKGIKIYCTETDTLYETSVLEFKSKGQYLHIKPHRAQIFLNRHYFTKTENYSKIKK